MTIKEIIDGLKFTVEMFLLDPITGETFTEPRNDLDKTTIDACKGAIELLEQEPCEDCISRQAVLALAKEECDTAIIPYRKFVKDVNALPPVTPKPKIGRWIMPQQDDGMSDPIYYQVRCSECNFDLDPQTWHQELHQYGADKYCPNCGAKMKGGR